MLISWLRQPLAVAVLLLASGCLRPVTPHADRADQPALDPILFFTGRTHGEGTLDTRFSGRRSLTVEGNGVAESDGGFRLDQTVTFADGAVEKRSWNMHRIDATHYAGSLSDAKGEMSGEAGGNLFRLRYLLRQPAVYMEQSLYLQPDGRTVLNFATVTVMGVPFARLSERIVKACTSGTCTPAR